MSLLELVRFLIGLLTSVVAAWLYLRWWTRNYLSRPAYLCYRCSTAFFESKAEWGPTTGPPAPGSSRLVMECPRCRCRDLIPFRLP